MRSLFSNYMSVASVNVQNIDRPGNIYCAGAQRRRFLFRNRTSRRSSVRPMSVCTGKRGKSPKPRASGEVTYSFDNNFSRFSRSRKKLRFRGKGMIWRDPPKVDFFHFFDYLKDARNLGVAICFFIVNKNRVEFST